MRPPIFAVAALFAAASARADFVNFETPQVHPIDLSPDGSTLAVCNTADNRVELFDLATGMPEPAGSIVVGLDPTSVRFRNDGELWVINQISDSVSVIDVSARVVSNTLRTDDEPADVVFAGFPQRAYVSCSRTDTVLVFDPTDLSSPPASIAIEGEEPRALAVSRDGLTVYAAVFESGNNTTILAGGGDGDVIDFPPNAVSDSRGPYGGTNPPPNAGTDFDPPKKAGNPAPPPVGLIVRKGGNGTWRDDNDANWSALVSGNLAAASGRINGWDLIDNDLAVIDTADDAVSYITGLMNICMAVGVNPASDEIFVVGTEATNEVRFEPKVNGTFVRVHVARIDAQHTGAAVGDLNPHLDYSSHTTTEGLREQSIGDPRGLAWRGDGSIGYVTGMGSNNVITIAPGGDRIDGEVIEVGEGPTGIVADDARSQLYVLNRFEGSVSVVDMSSHAETARVAFFDPTPDAIKIGRPHLYDTQRTSGLGQVSCASCHIDSRTDRLAWDLGDPGGEVVAVSSPRHNLGGNFFGLTSNFTDFHPMKGPMTTQTLQDIIGKEPHHWRGDRDGIEAFNGAFQTLLGDDTGLTPAEMQEFEDYLATITIPPNPFRNLDNTLPTDLPLTGHVTGSRFGASGQPMPNGNALRGFTDLYRPLARGIDRQALACVTCHTIPIGIGTDTMFSFAGFLPIAPGAKGERHHALVSVDGSSQRAIKVPQTRTLYDKMGFDMTSTRSRSGFGVLHDGSVDGLSRFLSEDAFEPEDDQEVADLVALMMAFSGSDFPGDPEGLEPPGTASQDAHAAVGQQETLVSSVSTNLLDDFVTLADAGAIDLVAHSTVSGVPRSWRYAGSNQFASDQAGLGESKATILSRASPSAPLTFTCVPTGCGERLGGDRDRDGMGDFDELRDFSPAVTGHQNPFQSNALDSTGDGGATEPDGIPDGQNDFDGDGTSNASELANGTNPADNLAVEVPFNDAIAVGVTVSLSWDAAPLGEYQIQLTDTLGSWEDADDGHFVASVAGGRLTWETNPSSLRHFYRILRLR